MKVLGYVNRFSRGIYRVQKELTENGNGGAFFVFLLITAFRVTERVSEKYFEAGFGTNATPKHPETTQEKENTTQKIIVKALKDKPETTQKELAKLIGISIDGIKYHIQKMTKEGIIKHEGSTKAGKWIILSE